MSRSAVTAASLNVRQGPGTSYKILGHLMRNDQVEVLGASPGGSWKNVRAASGLVGWCASSYLVALTDPAPLPEGGGGTGVLYRVTPAALNLRSGPGTNYSIVASLPRDEQVEALDPGPSGAWLRVRRTTGVTGWCALQYLSKIPAPPPPPPPADASAPRYRVTVYALNLRAGPGANFKILRYLHQGDIVQYIGYVPQGRWMQVRPADGNTGWCAAQYMTRLAAGGAPPAADPQDFEKLGLQRVLVDGLALRAAPGINEAVVMSLEAEQVVDAIEISPDRAWKKIATALGQYGWLPVGSLAGFGSVAEARPDEEFPWIPIAFGELRQREIPGSASNPRVLAYIDSTSLADLHLSLPDETDWCAAFVNWCIERAGVATPNAATVYPWMSWGQGLQAPRRGCIVTFQWEDGGQHVAFYLGEHDDRVIALGGNQSQAVWIKSYLTKFVTAYRIPSGWPPTH